MSFDSQGTLFSAYCVNITRFLLRVQMFAFSGETRGSCHVSPVVLCSILSSVGWSSKVAALSTVPTLGWESANTYHGACYLVLPTVRRHVSASGFVSESTWSTKTAQYEIIRASRILGRRE